jgi:hypothetical protein
MNKIYIFAAMLVLACSDGDKFSEEKHDGIFIDDISCRVYGDTLYLYEYIYMELEGNERDVSLRQLEGYLQNFFWVIDSDTIGDYWPRRKISYGEHFIQLSLIDIWGDTLSYSKTILIKEPLNITLLSPVNGYLEFSIGDTIMFDYKINDEEIEHAVYVCIGIGCYPWNSNNRLTGKIATMPGYPVRWGVMASTGEHTEIRSIWPKD